NSHWRFLLSFRIHGTPVSAILGRLQSSRQRRRCQTQPGGRSGDRCFRHCEADRVRTISMNIPFLHGWQSVPGGVKPTYLAQNGHQVINPKLPDEDFDEAVRIAQAEFDRHKPDVVVGSSRGGAVAMKIDSGDARLVLLCPAWRSHGNKRSVKNGTIILHSRADDV